MTNQCFTLKLCIMISYKPRGTSRYTCSIGSRLCLHVYDTQSIAARRKRALSLQEGAISTQTAVTHEPLSDTNRYQTVLENLLHHPPENGGTHLQIAPSCGVRDGSCIKNIQTQSWTKTNVGDENIAWSIALHHCCIYFTNAQHITTS